MGAETEANVRTTGPGVSRSRIAVLEQLRANATRRLGWGLADQVVSSLTNYAVSIYVVHALGTVQFGAFSLAFVTYPRSPSAARDAGPPMTSSPIPAARSQYLLDLLAQVPDPRKRRGRRHALAGLLAVGIAAEESTFRRAFALVSPDVLDRVLGAWLWTRAVQAGGRLVIAIDGRSVRGAKNKDGKAPHLVAALAHGIGAVLGQAAMDEKSNEIPAVRELLKASTYCRSARHNQDGNGSVSPAARCSDANKPEHNSVE